MKFKPYPKYKASGVEWLGDVPAHWLKRTLQQSAKTARYSFVDGPFGSDLKNEEYVDAGIPLIQLNNIGIGIHSLEKLKFVTEEKAAILCKHTAVPGDIVIAKMADPVARAAVVDNKFSLYVIVADCIKLVVNPATHNVQFIQYWINSPITNAIAESLSSGITRVRINLGNVKKLPLFEFDLDEQSAIASFLDRETTKIDMLIAKQEKLIDLLKEKRQAVISHAVTKGLDPTVPMKSSGVEWLGDVPEHWILMTLTRITQSKCDGPFGSGLKSEHYTASGARVIRLQNIRATNFHGTDAAYIALEYFENDLAKHDVQEGDLLIAGLGDDKNLVGRACVAPSGIAPALVKADCFRFRLDLGMAYPSYVAFQLCCSAEVDAGTLSSGSTRSRIPLSTMASRIIALPPTLEQKDIAEYIDSQTRKFDTLIAKAQQAIALQKEHRTALISAAVTGKIDVRNEIAMREAA